MALEKQNVQINFVKGLDTKSDPYQVPLGNFLTLQNSVFTKAGLLQKRNGYGSLPSLPDATSTYLTTFNGNLTAIGTSLTAYSSSIEGWKNKGTIKPVEVDVMPLIRSNISQSQCDSAIAENGLVCTVYTDTAFHYAIADSTTGQNVVAPTTLSTCNIAPRVFLLGAYFVIVFESTTANHLQYIAISTADPTIVTAATDLETNSAPSGSQGAFNGVVFNNNLYIAYNATDGGGAIRATYLDSTLVQHSSIVAAAGKTASLIALCADEANSTVYIVFYIGAGTTGWVLAVNSILNVQFAAVQWIAVGAVSNLTCAAQSNSCTIFYELAVSYSYTGSTNVLTYRTVSSAGALGTATTLRRSLGLASAAFILNSTMYVLGVYSSTYQSTYFLVDASGNLVLKLAYSNAGGYLIKGLPRVTVTDDVAQFPYLFTNLITPVNKGTAVASTSQTVGIYAQKGVNLATVTINNDQLISSEIASALHLSGGFLWMYDGYVAVEHGFHLYPDMTTLNLSTSGAGGSITAQDYYYVALYEWSDNQGNIHRSAPSVPAKQTTVGATSTNTIKVPTLRLTAKTANPVKIMVYRWSTAQQSYYQVTSVTSPTLNDLTVDSVTVTDTFADATLLGNSLLYTTGGVVENIGAPPVSSLTLYKSRLFLIDGEDKNLLWYSKTVIEATPVEMSDLFTIYVAPTVAAQGNTGPMQCLAAMDDKLIIFKKNAIYYLVGNGPDDTGANNDFSEPVFITSTVGCDNQRSIVSTPNGLMFQSDKGIWLLGRDLSTSYIGAPVEDFNDQEIFSALTIPGTNQVRFILDGGTRLMYDYFYGQWGEFVGATSISSALYQDVEACINSAGETFQETIGSYLDGSRPVTMNFTTGWVDVAGLQGFERAYFFYLLGTYLSPHTLTVGVAYDYESSVTQSSIITPDNYSAVYGSDSLYGGSSFYGGNSNIEQWRIFLKRQKCEAFRVTITESFDDSFGVAAGAGLTLSGLDLVVGGKSTYPRIKAARTVG